MHLLPRVGRVLSAAGLGRARLRGKELALLWAGLGWPQRDISFPHVVSHAQPCLSAFVYMAMSGFRESAEHTLILEPWGHNWHECPSTSFSWPKWVKRPAWI